MYQIEFTSEALDDLQLFRKHDQAKILEVIEIQLQHQPQVDTRNRKRLRPNRVAEWELRLGRSRVFYDVLEETKVAKIAAIGYKEGSQLYLHGEAFEL